jgi:hypothetical protein
LQEQVLAQGISFGGSQCRIERGAVELVVQVVSISFDICIHAKCPMAIDGPEIAPKLKIAPKL